MKAPPRSRNLRKLPMYYLRMLFLVLLLPGWVTAETWLLAITPERYTQGLLWQVSKPGVAPSYILGTMHVDDPEVLRILEHAYPLLDQSRVVCTEVEFTFEAMAAELATLTYNDGRTLKQVLPPDLYERTMQAAREYGLAEEMAMHFKPWALAYLLSFPQSDGEVMDMQIYGRALNQRKQTCSLESIEVHSTAFDRLDEKDHIEMLRMTLAMLGEIGDFYDKMRQYYVQRNLRGLVQLSVQSPWGDSELNGRLMKVLLIERNHIMARTMRDQANRGGGFFALGALHLTGPEGVLRLLEAQGFEVKVVY